MPTPAATGSLTIPKTCRRFASRLAPAIAWRLGVDSVMTSSSSPPTIARAIVFDVAASPSALYRRTESVRPSWYPDCRQPRQHAPGPFLDGRLRDVLEQRDRAYPRGRPRTRPRRSCPAARALPVGQQQHGRCRQDQGHREPQSKQTLDHPRIRAWGGRTAMRRQGTGAVTTPAGPRHN